MYTECDVSAIPFDSSTEVTERTGVVGQKRALDAIQFATQIKGAGYNIFAHGPAGTGKYTVVRHALEIAARGKDRPPDWCYVYNFEQPHKPNAIRLPAGRGSALRDDMAQLSEELSNVIPSAFETEDYQAQIEKLEQEFNERRNNALTELAEDARQKHIRLVHTPAGFAFAPMDRNDEVIRPENFDRLPDKKKKEVEDVISELQKQLQRVIHQFPIWQKETREKVKELDRQIGRYAVGHLISVIKDRYSDLTEITAHLECVEEDIVEHVREFRSDQEAPTLFGGRGASRAMALQRYEVNLLVDHGDDDCAPVVYQDLPSHANLVGRAEYQSQMGTLVTDFTLIKPGDLHRANGGYLILDVLRLLTQPFAWESLKRALRSGEIRIEPLERSLGLISTVSLDPEPIPLNVKVVLLGDRLVYYLLNQLDPEFADLFKVAADFEDSLNRNDETCADFARLIAGLAQEQSLKPVDKSGVARVVEYSARLANDSEKLSVHLRSISDLLQEAGYWADKANSEIITREHVQRAVDEKVHRSDRVREHVYEAIRRKIIDIDTSGARAGQINALSVITLGDFSFGQPSRVTATTRLGDGEVIDIERETELGGNIHSKGVLILSNFLASRYAKSHPLSLSASLVFEQSYGMVEGDSASLAELCALLSVLAGTPILQKYAVTGSVNQLGKVQAIGGVNQKIEGFFDVCVALGLTGDQGVLIPTSNVKHLMLRHDVVAAVRAGTFHIFPVASVNQAIERLTGVPAGERDSDGEFPVNSVNAKVEQQMIALADLRRRFAAKTDDNGG
ncbi:MAG: AAA family ATPase [Gammaproteobacteria bacterium]|nr:AAA family ATPase [Gammaproteobacteria bacterium]